MYRQIRLSSHLHVPRLIMWILPAALLLFFNLVAVPVATLDAPTHLRTEYDAQPLGIDTETPRLSWQLTSSVRGQMQYGYQVLVASSLDLLARDEADVWDSGRVPSDQSVYVYYGGPRLESRRRYYWKVRVWDGRNQVTAWSAPSWWEMGLLQRDDWTAEWISAPRVYHWQPFYDRRVNRQEQPPDAAPMLRKSFEVQRKPVRARLYISGLGYYEAYINGKKVSNRVLDPAFTRYDRRVLYSTIDVTELLDQGMNVLGVMLGNGWYNMPTKAVWGFDQAPWRDRPVLRSQLEIAYSDGSSEVVGTGEGWKAAPGPIQFNSIRQGETYDARLESDGWTEASFDDEDWADAQVVYGPRGVLSAQMLPPIKQTHAFEPISVKEPADGVYLFDIGQNIAGRARLRVSGPAGTRVTMRYGEVLRADGTLDQADVGAHLREGPVQTDVYVLKGDGEEVWEPRFVYHGFRYVEVTGLPAKPTKATVTGVAVHTAFDTTGAFTCSNKLLNRIQEATRWSYLNNFHGYPTDCPQREKNGWMGDAHLAAEAGLLNFGSEAAYAKWLTDIRDEQRTDGQLPGIVPTAGWGYFWGNGPAWDSALLLIPWYLYQYRGDVGILEDNYKAMKRYVDYARSRSDSLIARFGLGDWGTPSAQTPVEITSTGYLFKDAYVLAEAAGILGYTDDASHYRALADSVRKAFNHRFFRTDTGLYGAGTQTALGTALYQGLADPDQVKRVAALLADSVRANRNRLNTGILGTKYLLHALTDNGYSDVAYAVAAQTEYPSWGNWFLKHDATTLWEFWDGGSLNHIMLGDISAWFYQTLAGIRPTSPGFKTFAVRPYFPKDLDWVRAYHRSPYGSINSEWRRKGKKIEVDLVVPPNTTAMVYLPTREMTTVREGNRPVAGAEGIETIGMQAGNAVLRVGSGTYHFSTDNP